MKTLFLRTFGSMLPRVRTTDSPRGRTRDAILTTPTREESAAWGKHVAEVTQFAQGTRWVGDLQPVGAAMAPVLDRIRKIGDRQRQRDAISTVICELADFGSTLGTSEASAGPAGSLSFAGNDGLTMEEVAAANSFSRAATGDSSGAQMRRWRDDTGNAITTIQRQNDAFWASKPASSATPDKLLASGPVDRPAKSWMKA